MSRTMRGERVGHFETVRVAKDGRHLDMSVTVSPVLSAAGKMAGISRVLRDITGRKLAERAQHRLEVLSRLEPEMEQETPAKSGGAG